MKKSLICIALVMLAANSYAVGLTQEGAPNDNSVTKAYGINVAAKTGLKTLIPSDFKLYVHKEVVLPDYISWNIGKSWVEELSKVAHANNLNVLIKWDQKAVFVTTEKVIEDNKESTIIAAQAATTPLPKFGAKPVIEKTQPVEQVAVVPVKKIEEPTTAKITSEPVPVVKKEPSWEDFKYTAPTAFSKMSVRQTTQALANSFNYRLVFDLPDFKMPGPVTLFKNSVNEDVALLNAALGYYHYAYVVFENNAIVVKLKPNRVIASRDLIPVAPMALPYVPNTAEDATPSTSKVSVAGSLGANESVVAPAVSITIVKGTTLESALYAKAKEQGYLLEWKVAGGFEATKSLNYSSNTFESLLKEVLPKVGLTYELKNKTITVTPGASSL